MRISKILGLSLATQQRFEFKLLYLLQITLQDWSSGVFAERRAVQGGFSVLSEPFVYFTSIKKITSIIFCPPNTVCRSVGKVPLHEPTVADFCQYWGVPKCPTVWEMQKQRRNKAGKELLSCSQKLAPSQRVKTNVMVHLLECFRERWTWILRTAGQNHLQAAEIFPALLWEGNLQEVHTVGFLWVFCTGPKFSHGSIPSRGSTIRIQGFQSCLPSAASERNCRMQWWWSRELETSQTLHGASH